APPLAAAVERAERHQRQLHGRAGSAVRNLEAQLARTPPRLSLAYIVGLLAYPLLTSALLDLPPFAAPILEVLRPLQVHVRPRAGHDPRAEAVAPTERVSLDQPALELVEWTRAPLADAPGRRYAGRVANVSPANVRETLVRVHGHDEHGAVVASGWSWI